MIDILWKWELVNYIKFKELLWGAKKVMFSNKVKKVTKVMKRVVLINK